jgi:hypothetical protein
MNNGGNDCQRISRRVALSGAALALGAAAIATAVSQAAAQQKISQADAKYQGTPKGDQLRRLHQFPAAERVQIRSRRHQPERLVPTVYHEELI